jgi:nucleoside-diphosphate-sugar epimerase|tara:strand:+ start:4190 stop:5161 length:972 start_codon:yes stop_codon:yes gene_type:complete
LDNVERHDYREGKKIMRVLITGGAGYIGSELIEHLLPEHEVFVIDNLMYDKTSLIRYVGRDNFHFIKGDVRDTNLMKQYMSKCDVIIPLAALVGFPLCDRMPKDAIEINYEANKWIAENKSSQQMVIYPCTNSGYGTNAEGSVVTEEFPLNPISLYGTTKVDAETVYRNTENCCTYRLATVYGPSTRPRTDLLVNNFVLKAIKDRVLVLYECEFMRNYVHIWDICRSFKFAIDNWSVFKNDTFNVGNDAINMNKLQLAQKIQSHLPVEIIKAEFTTDPDKRDYTVSSQKIYNTGYNCEYDLDIGIKQLIEMYSIIDHPWHANY